jgi:hypothetical protein
MKISDILNEELQSRLISLKDAISKASWELGDIVNEIYDIVVANSLPYTKQQICEYVAAFTDAELSALTLMDYARVAARFAPEIRQEYEYLPFSHFRAAMRHPDPVKILEFSAEQMDKRGKPMPASRLLEIAAQAPSDPEAYYRQVAVSHPAIPSQSAELGEPVLPLALPDEPDSESMANGGDDLLLRIAQMIDAILPAIRYKYPDLSTLLARLSYSLKQIAKGELRPNEIVL